MASLSLFLLLVLNLFYRSIYGAPQEQLAPVTASPQFLQSGPAPDLQQPASAGAPSCGGCYVVADVAGLVWYSEIFIHTAATQVVSVGVGNGTSATRTSIQSDEGAFTYNLASGAAGGALTQLNFQPEATVGGAILTSPTAYNVFTAYSITSAYSSNGICITSSGAPTKLSSAYTEVLSSASGKVYLDANGQQSFINFLGFSSCSGGGLDVTPTALLQITQTTATTTSTYSNVPLAAAMATLTIAPQSAPSFAAASTTPPITSFPSASIPQIVVGNKTITPNPNPIGLSTYNGTFVSATGTFAASSIAVLPTGTGAANASIVPFFGAANSLTRTDTWLMNVWGVGMLTMGAFVYYL